ncbi:PLP-dependent aminotransferase family protein, partial [Bacillus mobilis]
NRKNTLGIHTCLEIEKNIAIETIIKNLRENQISIDSVDRNYLNDFHKEKLLKLNVSNVKEDKIEEGIRKLIEEIKQVGRITFQFKKEKNK